MLSCSRLFIYSISFIQAGLALGEFSCYAVLAMISSPQHMKHQLTIGASGSKATKLRSANIELSEADIAAINVSLNIWIWKFDNQDAMPDKS